MVLFSRTLDWKELNSLQDEIDKLIQRGPTIMEKSLTTIRLHWFGWSVYSPAMCLDGLCSPSRLSFWLMLSAWDGTIRFQKGRITARLAIEHERPLKPNSFIVGKRMPSYAALMIPCLMEVFKPKRWHNNDVVFQPESPLKFTAFQDEAKDNFGTVFAATGVNMETAQFF
ncbi:hypothetical protein MRB53_006172 [Persea americana]|uniref:Uncharacterized protein n=1 Tax=Persea americana TaxID=3435 RepID=A0ACC2MFE4_PERAE|nr:hypothetical protein MRB53_006172 [Persea americana]